LARRQLNAEPDFQQNLDAVLDAITPKTRLILSNPTIQPAPDFAAHIDRFMSRVRKIYVVSDEAYFSFLDNPPDTCDSFAKVEHRHPAYLFPNHGLAVCASGTASRGPT